MMNPIILKQPKFKQKAKPSKTSKPALSGTKPKNQKSMMDKFAPRRPQSKKEEAEFGPGLKEFIICRDCNAAYYDKSWHHGLEDYKHFKKDKKINFKTCFACQMIKNKQYEGMVTIENFPKDSMSDLINLIKNIGERAFKRDPLDRIIKLKQDKNKIIVTTTENQLVISIANQIKCAFKNYKPKQEVNWSEREDVTRITLK